MVFMMWELCLEKTMINGVFYWTTLLSCISSVSVIVCLKIVHTGGRPIGLASLL